MLDDKARDVSVMWNCGLCMLWGMWHPLPTWVMVGGWLIPLGFFVIRWQLDVHRR